MNDKRFGYILKRHITIFKQETFLFQQISEFLHIFPGNTNGKSDQSKVMSGLDLEH